MKKKICIFDMDGLLIDSEKGMWFRNEEIALRELGYEYDNPFFRTLMGRPFIACKDELYGRYGNDFPLESFLSRIYELNEEQILNNGIELMPGVKEILAYLKNKNIECVVGTSTQKHLALKMLENLGILDYFSEVHSGTEVNNPKPAPDIFLLCLKDYKPQEAFVFEDSHNGIRAAVNAGIDVIVVEDAAPLTEEDYSDAYKVLHQIDEAIELI
ncbi:MAG: HAD family phosphatase [Solobacterium sp.]|nr:HAD family phosphatase [Solobacterium sp.]